MNKLIFAGLALVIPVATFAAEHAPANPGKTPPLVYSSNVGGAKVEITGVTPKGGEPVALHRYVIRVDGDGVSSFESTFVIPRGMTHAESGGGNPNKCPSPAVGMPELPNETSLIAAESDKVPDVLAVYFSRQLVTCGDDGLPQVVGKSIQFGTRIQAGATVKKSQNGFNVTVTRVN